MDDSSLSDESTNRLQMLLDLVVCIFNVQSLVVTNDLSKLAILIDRDWSLALLNQAVFKTGVIIVLTKAW